jgi:hypothetical protein
MTVGDTGLEPRRIPGREDRLPVVLAQDQRTLDDKDELILGGMPVALGGLRARSQPGQVDAELIEADHVAQPLA